MSDKSRAGDEQRNKGGINIQGRDVSIGGDIVEGDKVIGDKVAGDKITTGNVSGTGVAIGRGAEISVTQGGDSAAVLADLFKEIYSKVEARAEDPDVEKEEITETVQKVEQEAAKGEAANPNKVERWLKTLAGIAPDIWDVTVQTLISPAAGIAEVVRKVAAKMKEESGGVGAGESG